MKRKWKKLNSKVVYSNPWMKVREDAVIRPDGKEGIYAFLEKPAGCWIIALDFENSVYLIREYRYPLKKSFLQIPAGTADSKDVFQQAKKELLEETGIEAVKWEKLGGFYQGIGHETTYANIFLAQELDLSGLKIDNQESNEGIEEIIKVSLPKLKKMILKGEIECAMTLAAFNLFFLKMGK